MRSFGVLLLAIPLIAVFFTRSIFLTPSTTNTNGMHDQIGCTILTTRGEVIKSFPGDYCIFLPDGGYIAASEEQKALVKYAPNGGIIWSLPKRVNHQMKLSNDGKHILLLGAEEVADIREAISKKEFFLYETVELIDLDGNLVRKFSTFQHRDEINGLVNEDNRAWLKSMQANYYQFTHANSVYEIGETRLSDKIPAFAKGNFLVGLNVYKAIIILDRNLTSILYSVRVDAAAQFHDAQLLSDGRLAYYDNGAKGNSSQIRTIDPLTGKASKLEINNAAFQGCNLRSGFQQLDDGTFVLNDCPNEIGRISHVSKAGELIDSYTYKGTMADEYGKVYLPYQEVKRRNLSEFLKNTQL